MEHPGISRRALRDAGRHEEALKMQYEIMENRTFDSPVEERANDYNYLSVILRDLKRWTEAEDAAREAIRLINERTDIRGYDEKLGCYKSVLAEVLLHQGEYDEGLKVNEESLAHYSVLHDPPDDFLNRMNSRYEKMKVWVQKQKEIQQGAGGES